VNDAAPPACTSCRAPLWDTELEAGRWACFRCEDQAAEQLHAIRGTFKRLNTLDGLMKTRGAPAIGSRSNEAPIPARLAVLNHTGPGGIVMRLQSGIEDAWRRALGWRPGPNRHHADIDGATTFLINNLPWACERYDEIAHDLKTIASIHGTLKALETGEPGPRKFAAYCSTDDCTGEMRITLWTVRATCPDCDTDYDKSGLAGLRTELDPDPAVEPAA
jgi:hypothetical protein